MTYSDKLKDPRWQKKRLEILNRDFFTCSSCGDTSTELHIHHTKYVSGKNPWDYKNETLKTLCKYCHFIVEYFKNIKEQVINCRTNYNSELIGAHIVITKWQDFDSPLFTVYFIDFKNGELNIDSIISDELIMFIFENLKLEDATNKIS